jgi:hypothetical protein
VNESAGGGRARAAATAIDRARGADAGLQPGAGGGGPVRNLVNIIASACWVVAFVLFDREAGAVRVPVGGVLFGLAVVVVALLFEGYELATVWPGLMR